MPGRRDLTYQPNNEAAAAQLAEFGTFLAYFNGAPGEREADEVRKWALDVAASGSPNAVYMDTTTIVTARRLLGGEAPSYPAALFDLANFVNAIILSDTVFHLESPHLDSVEFNEFLGLANDPPLIAVPTTTAGDGVGAVLRGGWLQSMEYAQRIGSGLAGLAADAEQIKASWETIVGSEIDWTNWGERACDFTSRAYGDISVPSDILEAAVKLFHEDIASFYLSSTAGRQHLSDFILECDNRSLFNLTVANVLRLQYVPNTFRLPFHQFLFRKGYAARQRFVRLVDDTHQRALAKIFATGARMRLPFFLSAVLEKSSNLAEFREVLADCRSRAAPFRRRRAELNAAVADGNAISIKAIGDALAREEAPKLWHLGAAVVGVWSVAAVAASVEGLQPGAMHALDIAAEVTVAPSVGIAMHALPHVLRPRPRFLTHMAEAAAKLGDARVRIHQIWNTPRPPDDDFAEALNRLAALEY